MFDEDMEQIQACDLNQAAMETEFETFSELMTEKESLLDEDLDKLDVRDTKRQSLESEFEAYSMVLEERNSYLSEEMVRQKLHARTLEMTSHFEPFTELMEGEEILLRDSLEKLDLNTKTELVSDATPAGKVSVTLELAAEHEGPRSSSVDDISHQLLGPATEVRSKESLVLSEGSELNLSGLDILQIDSGITETGATRTSLMG